MRKVYALLALSGALAFAIPVAHAGPYTFTGVLSGLNENPANASPGFGSALITFDPVAHVLRIRTSFSNLLGITTAAHIHCCADAPANAPVATQTPSFIGFPTGVSSGVYEGVFDTSLASTYRPGFITANSGSVALAEAALFEGIKKGQAYLNIHTNLFPGGEIRSFLQAPEPASLGLLGLALAGLGLRVRRKTR